MQLIIATMALVLLKEAALMKYDSGNFENNEGLSDGEDVLMACGNLNFQLRNHIKLETNSKNCQEQLNNWLLEINDKLLKINIKATNLTWRMSVEGKGLDPSDTTNFEENRLKWRKDVCDKVSNIEDVLIDESQRRQLYFLCRGAFYNRVESETSSRALGMMQKIYTTSKICVPHYSEKEGKDLNVTQTEEAVLTYLGAVNDLYRMGEDSGSAVSKISDEVVDMAAEISAQLVDEDRNNLCFSGEPDLERLMTRSRQELMLRWGWLSWREKVGPPLRFLYPAMVDAENSGARRAGYNDIGEVWRDELEIPNLLILMDKLYNDIRDLYVSLHGVARFFLRRSYGPEIVSERGPIPAHILGNLWAQNWEPIIDLISPQAARVNLDETIKSTNWSTFDMLKRAEDFYTSMGLPPMTEKFWKYSYFGGNSNSSSGKEKNKCHGTAANMFMKDDYRMIYCAGRSMEDFYVIHHEMGHIEYYMAYNKNLPILFQNGANSAFQESVGDAIMYGVLTPQHLQRLGLIDDQLMYHSKNFHVKNNQMESDSIKNNKNFDLFMNSRLNTLSKAFKNQDTLDIGLDTILILRQALSKIPQIPFGYMIDKYRWDIFSGKIKPNEYNKAFWSYVKEFQGVEPPNNEQRSEKYFDAGAKFHIPDNTPYVRYFLSSFLSIQFYRAMCQWSLFDKASPELELPLPLHQCDIYGSKTAGHKLREMMSKGSSIHWSDALNILTGGSNITSSAFQEYFAQLKSVLLRLIHQHNIPLGCHTISAEFWPPEQCFSKPSCQSTSRGLRQVQLCDYDANTKGFFYMEFIATARHHYKNFKTFCNHIRKVALVYGPKSRCYPSDVVLFFCQ